MFHAFPVPLLSRPPVSGPIQTSPDRDLRLALSRYPISRAPPLHTHKPLIRPWLLKELPPPLPFPPPFPPLPLPPPSSPSLPPFPSQLLSCLASLPTRSGICSSGLSSSARPREAALPLPPGGRSVARVGTRKTGRLRRVYPEHEWCPLGLSSCLFGFRRGKREKERRETLRRVWVGVCFGHPCWNAFKRQPRKPMPFWRLPQRGQGQSCRIEGDLRGQGSGPEMCGYEFESGTRGFMPTQQVGFRRSFCPDKNQPESAPSTKHSRAHTHTHTHTHLNSRWRVLIFRVQLMSFEYNWQVSSTMSFGSQYTWLPCSYFNRDTQKQRRFREGTKRTFTNITIAGTSS